MNLLEPLTIAAVLLAGALIGATGIGGVLVVPALAQFEGMPWPQAIAVSAGAFALPGVAALWWWWRGGERDARVGWLIAATLPFAALGALLVHRIDAGWLLALLGLLALATGLRGLLETSRRHATAPDGGGPQLGPTGQCALGATTGLGSALTGTGGPVLLVPLLMLLRQPLALTIVAAQAVQLPVALTAGTAHWMQGALSLRDVLGLGLLLLAGSLAGQRLARRWSQRTLKRMVSLLLLAVGAWYAVRIAQLLWS